MYNKTWRNERTVEIPIVWEYVKPYLDKEILEIGNVMAHYYSFMHDVVDKYEKAPGVINRDAVDFQTEKTYDLIISISTFEHIGWDEEPRDPSRILLAFDAIKKLLAPQGKMIVTLPIGYNSYLDSLLNENALPFSEMFYLQRISRGNTWKEVTWDDIRNAQFNKPYQAANGLIIGIFEKT